MIENCIHIDEEPDNDNWLHSMRKPTIEKFFEKIEDILKGGVGSGIKGHRTNYSDGKARTIQEKKVEEAIEKVRRYGKLLSNKQEKALLKKVNFFMDKMYKKYDKELNRRTKFGGIRQKYKEQIFRIGMSHYLTEKQQTEWKVIREKYKKYLDSMSEYLDLESDVWQAFGSKYEKAAVIEEFGESFYKTFSIKD